MKAVHFLKGIKLHYLGTKMYHLCTNMQTLGIIMGQGFFFLRVYV